jgi:hypothetical protein
VVGMSGGVDSSVAALLLKKQVGLFILILGFCIVDEYELFPILLCVYYAYIYKYMQLYNC